MAHIQTLPTLPLGLIPTQVRTSLGFVIDSTAETQLLRGESGEGDNYMYLQERNLPAQWVASLLVAPAESC